MCKRVTSGRSSPRLVLHNMQKGCIREGEFSEVSLTTMCTRVESRRRSSPRLVLHAYKGGIGEEFSEVSLTQCHH